MKKKKKTIVLHEGSGPCMHPEDLGYYAAVPVPQDAPAFRKDILVVEKTELDFRFKLYLSAWSFLAGSIGGSLLQIFINHFFGGNIK